MNPVYIFIFFINIILKVRGNDNVPALLWTSGESNGRENDLAVKKIKSDFESYILGVLGGRRPLIMIFLEQNLDDFKWKDDKWNDSFPFLSNLTANSRVEYFRSVHSPHQTLMEFAKLGYKLKRLKPGAKFVANEGDLWVLEFNEETSPEPETMRTHDKIIEEVHGRLTDSRKPWISIYTAKHGNNKKFISNLIQQMSRHVDETFRGRSQKAISLYTDSYTGFTLMTKGSIQLYLPSLKNLALNSYLGASAKPSSNKMEFFIWFQNYTLTFHLKNKKRNWVMQGAKLVNENGQSLTLAPRQSALSQNKCYVQLMEFQSEGKPIVKLKLPKYKFLKLNANDPTCEKPYGFLLVFLLILTSLITAALFWERMLQNLNFSKRPNVVRISINELMPFSSRTLPYRF